MDYKLLFDMAVFAGELLMKNGAETYRVEDTMYRILQKSQLNTVQVLAMMTGFVATLDDPKMDSLTVVRRISSRGTNLAVIDQVNDISRAFCEDELPLEEAFRQMKALWKAPKKNIFCGIPAALLTSGFAIMFGATIIEFVIAFVVGFVSACILYLCKHMKLHMFLENCICCIFLAMTTRLVVGLLPGTYDTNVIIISCIMPFVPGAAITNAVFDTLHGDYLSGLARAAEAFVIATSVAVGIGIGMLIV